MVVLDTSALLYWLFDRTSLTQSAKESLDKTDKLLISTISIWEIGLKIQKQKLNLPLSASQVKKRLLQVERVEIVAVDAKNWLQSLELDWAHRDPADRVIVALAELNNASLITPDREMHRFYNAVIW